MQNNGSVKIGDFEVPFTSELRDMFSRTHDMMSGSKPADQQYPYEEQYEMYLLCEVVLPDDETKLDLEKTEDNILEMIHHLHENGVAVPAIIGKLKDSGVRCFSTRTQSLAMRLHMRDVRLSRTRQSSDLQFKAPALATTGAVA